MPSFVFKSTCRATARAVGEGRKTRARDGRTRERQAEGKNEEATAQATRGRASVARPFVFGREALVGAEEQTREREERKKGGPHLFI